MNVALPYGTVLLVASSAFPCLLSLAFFGRIGTTGRLLLFPLAPLPALSAAIFLQSGLSLELDWIFFGGSFGIDPMGRFFLFFTSLLWFAAGLYAFFYFDKGRRRDRFFAFFLLSQSGNLGLILAQDMLSFYLFFALMSFSSYGLIIHHGDAPALRAGRVYMALVVLGEAMLFAALVMLADNAGTVRFNELGGAVRSHLTIALLFFSFGIKAGALPFHFWLPLAHPVAPVPASAVLSGVMIKAGLLGWIRFLPTGEGVAPEWGVFLLFMGLIAAFAAVAAGVGQDDAKTVLAYSSISQMGLITVGLGGAALLQSGGHFPASSAVTFYALHHALTKGALFLGAGVMIRSSGRPLVRLFVFCGLVYCALSLSGLPFTSGAAAKAGLKGLAAGLPPAWEKWLPTLLFWAAVGTTLLMARFLALVGTVPQAKKENGMPPRAAMKQPSPLPIMLVWAGLVAGLLPLPWLLGEESAAFADPAGGWPVALGAAIAGGCWLLRRKRVLPRPLPVPAGDIVVLIEKIGRAACSLAMRCGEIASVYRRRLTDMIAAATDAARLYTTGMGERLGFYEQAGQRWLVAGGCWLGLTVLFYLLS